MTRKRDDCRSIEELIHLSIDGRLDAEGKRRLEEHIASCARCAEKLERLRATEAGARSVGLDEPPSPYWSTFSRRVIEKIEAGAGGKPAWNWTSAFAGLFTGPRLRLAAAVASLAIVVLAGALYLHNRGSLVPSVPARNEVGAVSQAPGTAEPEAGPAVKPKTETKAQQKSESAVESKLETAARLESEPARTVSSERARAAAAESAAAYRVEPSAVTVAELHRVDTLGSARSPAVAERSKERAAIVDSMMQATKMQQASRTAQAITEKRVEHAEMAFDRGAASTTRGESFMLDGATVRRVSVADTSMSEDALRSVIYQWRSHIERNPFDPRNNEGYVQVANAYCLLARLTRDEAVISRGARLVQEYADRASDPELKTVLLDSKARIESFRRK
jgi:hypothetical protein